MTKNKTRFFSLPVLTPTPFWKRLACVKNFFKRYRCDQVMRDIDDKPKGAREPACVSSKPFGLQRPPRDVTLTLSEYLDSRAAGKRAGTAEESREPRLKNSYELNA